MSYTIAFSNPPAGANDLINQTSPAFVGGQNNNFSVSQTFGAGIVDNGNLSVAGTSSFVGKCTFTAQPEFLGGILVDIGEADVGTLDVSGLTSLKGGLTVLGAVSLPSASIVQSEVANGYVDLLSAQSISGIKTLSSPPVMSGASISAGTIPASSIVANSISSSQIVPSGIVQTSIASGYVDLVNAQSISGIKTLSSPPVMSGASISVGTIPASSIVVDSIGDAQIASAGVGQTSIASGYVDLVNAQSIAGQKLFSASASFQAGLSSAAGAQILGGTLSCAQIAPTSIVNSGSLSSTTGTFSGAVSCSALNCSSVVDAGTLSCTTLTCSTLTDTGALTSTTAVHSGLVTCNAGITIPIAQPISLLGNITCSPTITAITPAGGVSSINLNSFNKTSYSISLTATMTALTLTGLAVNQEFDIFVTIGAGGVNINKALSSGGITIYNNLAGNQAAANNSRWWLQGKTISSTVVYLTITNIT